jgi:hypothetical protein
MQASWVHSFGLAYTDSDRKEERDRITTLKGDPGKCVVDEIRQHAPLTWREPRKISKLLLVDFAATHLNKVTKILVFQQKFPTCKNQKFKLILLTYLILLANKFEMNE